MEVIGADFWGILKQKRQAYNFIYIICAVKLFEITIFTAEIYGITLSRLWSYKMHYYFTQKMLVSKFKTKIM